MALTLTEIYNQKRRRHGADPDNDSFTASFLSAANRVLVDLENRAHADPDLVGSQSDDTDLDHRYVPVLTAGIDYYLDAEGVWRIDDPVDLFNAYQLLLSRANAIYFKDNAPTGHSGVVNPV